MSLINTQVQPFKVNAFHNGKFIEVTEESLKGKWSVLIFMPAAFTFNCPTEIEDAANNYGEFQKAGAEVYIVTTDTHFSHKVWHETSPAVGKAQFPLIGDPTHQLTNAFGVHIPEEGLALRGTFVINPEGVIKTVEIHSNEIARDVGETVRKLKAAQYTAAHPGEVCPAKWKEGEKTLAPSWTWSARSKTAPAAFAASLSGGRSLADRPPFTSQRAVQGGCPIRRGYVCPNFEELNHVGRQS